MVGKSRISTKKKEVEVLGGKKWGRETEISKNQRSAQWINRRGPPARKSSRGGGRRIFINIEASPPEARKQTKGNYLGEKNSFLKVVR